MVQFTTNDPSSPSLLILQSPQSSHNHHHHYCHVTITSFRQFWTRFWQQLQHVFPFRSRKNKLRVIQVVNRSYPNFKPSNPKSQPAWLVGPPLVSTSLPPFRLNQKKTSWFFRRKNFGIFCRNFPEVRLPRVIVPACAGACWIAWTGQPQGSLEGQLWWIIGGRSGGEGGEQWSREKKVGWGKKAGEWWWNFRVDSPGIFSFLIFVLMRHKTTYDSSPFFVHPEETRCATKRVFQSGNFILGQERGHSPTFFSCFEDVNFPGPTSIKISCVCSSELLHWFDPAFFLKKCHCLSCFKTPCSEHIGQTDKSWHYWPVSYSKPQWYWSIFFRLLSLWFELPTHVPTIEKNLQETMTLVGIQYHCWCPSVLFWNHLQRGCIVHDVTESFVYIYIYCVHIYMACGMKSIYNSHVNIVATSLQLHLRWVLFDPKV